MCVTRPGTEGEGSGCVLDASHSATLTKTWDAFNFWEVKTCLEILIPAEAVVEAACNAALCWQFRESFWFQPAEGPITFCL